MASWIGTALKILLLSLVVGLVMAWFGVRPGEVWQAVGENMGEAARRGFAAIDDVWKYILLGAGIVVPIWLVAFVVGRLRRK
jgi:hypothetical protein